jgi:hypothetical protein
VILFRYRSTGSTIPERILMFSSKRRFIIKLLLPSLLTAFLLLALPASQAATAHQQEFAAQITPPAYLELSVEPSMVHAGELVTL